MGTRRIGRLQIDLGRKEVRWARLEKKEQTKGTDEEIKVTQPIEADVIAIRRLPQADSLYGKTIAVQLHLFYIDLIGEFIHYFSNIPFDFDLYISCKVNEDLVYVAKRFAILEHAKKIIVRPAPNRGRDIMPVYVLFAKELAKHDYFMHVHSKKSFHLKAGQTDWRTKELEGICGSEEQVRKIIGLFQNPVGIGLYYPDTYEDLSINAHSWTMNKENGKKLSKRLGFRYEDTLFNYPVGSFFWAKVEAIRPMLEAGFMVHEFPEEAGQLDGTLAHALERAIAFVSKSRGYIPAIVDVDEGIIRIGISRKLYRNYFSQTPKSFEQKLMKFSAVSFAIFDTLVTRKVLEQKDIRRIIQEKQDLPEDNADSATASLSLCFQ